MSGIRLSRGDDDTPEVTEDSYQDEEKAEPVPIFEKSVPDVPKDIPSRVMDDPKVAESICSDEEKAEPVPILEESDNVAMDDIPFDSQASGQNLLSSDKGYIVHQGKKYPIDKVFIVKKQDDCIIFKAYVNNE